MQWQSVLLKCSVVQTPLNQMFGREINPGPPNSNMLPSELQLHTQGVKREHRAVRLGEELWNSSLNTVKRESQGLMRTRIVLAELI